MVVDCRAQADEKKLMDVMSHDAERKFNRLFQGACAAVGEDFFAKVLTNVGEW